MYSKYCVSVSVKERVKENRRMRKVYCYSNKLEEAAM